MTPEITELIKKKAIEKFPKQLGDKHVAYTTGQIETIEMMIGFIEWKDKKKYILHEGFVEPIYYNDQPIAGKQVYFTIIELLTKYIKEINQPN